MSTGAIMMVCLHFYTLFLQWTSTMLRRYQARLFDLKSQFCGLYICLYTECGQSISWLLTSGTAYHSQPEGSNSQRNVFHGECLFINLKNMNFWSWTTFHPRSYMLENLTLYLWELWLDFKNVTLYIENLCIWELFILEAEREICCNLALCGMHWLGKIFWIAKIGWKAVIEGPVKMEV